MDIRDPAISELVEQLTSCQTRLYAYIMTLVLDPNLADDVLQQTNLTIWAKAAEFIGSRDFAARACRVAYFQVLASRRNLLRERRRLLFDDTLLQDIAQAASEKVASMRRSYLPALRDCMRELPDHHRELLRHRYSSGRAVNAIAASRGESADATSVLLFRIRKKLLACIQQSLKEDEDKHR
jgi:RNA polymerase sigma-70 factor, ECF subfamily